MSFLGKRISRSNILLIAAVVLFTITSLLIVNLIQIKKNQLQSVLLQESTRVESALMEKFNSTSIVIKKMGEEIAKNPTNKNHIKGILEKYKSDTSLNQIFSWTIFSWANAQSQITVDGYYGILKEPYDLSKRDYIPLAISTPNKMFLGKPVYGSTSEKWMIPGGVAITDADNKFLGTIAIGFEIGNLAKIIQSEIANKSINIQLVYKDSTPVFDVSSAVVNIFSAEKSNLSEFRKNLSEEITIKKPIGTFPYELNISYEETALSQIMWEVFYSRFLEILAIISLSAILIFVIYRSEKDKKKRISALVLVNKSKSDFVFQLGHEFGNFVSAIIGLSDLVKDGIRKNGDKNNIEISHLEHIDDISHELMTFISDLIDLNKPEDGKFECNLSSCDTDFEDLIFRSIRILKSKSKNQQVSIYSNFEENLPVVRNLDQRRIKQILVSVLGASIKRSHKLSKIDVSVKTLNSSGVEITVKDYGSIMSNSEIRDSFSEYNFKDFDHYDEEGSIELKMPIVRFLIEKQNGSISINSTKNHGTEVKISFH